jgi:hypothetical protein
MTLRTPAHSIRLLDAIREISRSAHRWRDRAAAHYEASHYKRATSAKGKKDACYALKERGIMEGHRLGILRYAGASPQGMGVYEYGDGGMSCFHSCLHPRGAERALIPDHPETLLVAAKRQQVRICDAEFTLQAIPIVSYADPRWQDYERSSPPRMRQPITCYECGEEGHIARNCPERYASYEDGEGLDLEPRWSSSL